MLTRTVTAAFATALAAVGVPPSRALAQDSSSTGVARLEPAPTIGTRVRAASAQLGPRPVVFTFNGMRSDTLLLRPTTRRLGAADMAVALDDLSRLEVSRGWRHRAIGAGLVAAAGGGTLGGVHAYNSWEAPEPPGVSCGPIIGCLEKGRPGDKRRVDTLQGLVGGAALGFLSGFFVGRFVLGERWVRVTPRLAR